MDAIDFYLKLSLIKMYRECLWERVRFKKIARDYGLINNATALINSHARVMSNHTMYYNSFNFIVNNSNNNNLNANSNNGGPTSSSTSLATIANSHYLNGSNGSASLTNGHLMDESMTNSSNSNSNNTFNINSLDAWKEARQTLRKR